MRISHFKINFKYQKQNFHFLFGLIMIDENIKFSSWAFSHRFLVLSLQSADAFEIILITVFRSS